MSQKNIDRKAVLDYMLTAFPAPGAMSYRQDMQGDLNSKELEKHSSFLIGLRKFACHFNKLFLTGILQELADTKEQTWHLGAEQKAFASEHTAMIRAMLHDVSQNVLKHNQKLKDAPKVKPTKWLKPFVEAEAAPKAKSSEEQVEKFWYGYDPVAKVAYRHLLSDAKKKREYCATMQPPAAKDGEEVSADAEIQGIWPDGALYSVPGVTCKAFLDFSKSCRPSANDSKKPTGDDEKERKKEVKEVYWQGKNENGDEIKVKRSDAKEKSLVIAWFKKVGETKHQLLQIVLNTMEEANQQRAIDFLVGIMKEFSKKSKLTKEDMENRKKEFLRSLKKPTTAATAAPMKRKRVKSGPSASEEKQIPKKKILESSPGDENHDSEECDEDLDGESYHGDGEAETDLEENNSQDEKNDTCGQKPEAVSNPIRFGFDSDPLLCMPPEKGQLEF